MNLITLKTCAIISDLVWLTDLEKRGLWSMGKILTQLSITGYHGTIEGEICISPINLVAARVDFDSAPKPQRGARTSAPDIGPSEETD